MRSALRLALVGIAVAVGSAASAATYTVTNTGDSGMGTLRQAILDANANVNVVDLIDFDIAGPPFTIKPTSPLPTITDPVTIDGYTQNGASPNPSLIGTDAVLLIEIDGSLAGDTDGLLIQHVTNLGAGTTIRGLIINNFASNMRAAIRINDDGNNVIEGNFIGTNASGLLARPNFDGVSIALGADDNLIGGSTFAAANLISGNINRGVVLDTEDNNIKGNYIGTDRTGQVALGNGAGIVLFQFAANNVIGAFVIFNPERNTISGNLNGGIIIGTNSVGHDIVANRIGLDVFGLTVLGNGTGAGIQVGGNFTTITFNQIAGASTGISIGAVTNTVVQGNLIGLPGTANTGPGIAIFEGNNNLIGGDSAQGNVIAGNGVGVQVARLNNPADGNAILSNQIFRNAGLGIELVNGANNNQPAPLLTSADGLNHVVGTLTAAPSTAYQIQFFANAECDPSGSGEGQTFIGALTAATDGGGMLAFDQMLGSTPGLPIITATATDPNNNTSQFSNCVLNRDALVAPVPALDAVGLAAALLVLLGISQRRIAARAKQRAAR